MKVWEIIKEHHNIIEENIGKEIINYRNNMVYSEEEWELREKELQEVIESLTATLNDRRDREKKFNQEWKEKVEKFRNEFPFMEKVARKNNGNIYFYDMKLIFEKAFGDEE